MTRWIAVVVALWIGVALHAGAATAAGEDSAYSDALRERRSGYAYLNRDIRAMQDDDFSNPGMFWVEQGGREWNAISSATATATRACVECHGSATQSMRGVAARYPAYDPSGKQVINLEQRINQCRVQHQQSKPLVYESRELLALTAYLNFQSRGLPVDVRIDGPAEQSFARGRVEYERRRGQFDMSCAGCHVDRSGARLRGDVISQGQINGHPVYRLTWQTLGSTHRMFAWCNQAVRAEPYAYGSKEYVDLELFVKWLGRGLPIETPGVRR